MGHSGDQGLLLVFIWCSGRTIVSIEVLFVIHSLRELHFTSTYISFFLELFVFSWQALLFVYPWQQSINHYLMWINLFEGRLNTHTCNWYYFDFQNSVKHILLFFFPTWKFLLMRNCHQHEGIQNFHIKHNSVIGLKDQQFYIPSYFFLTFLTFPQSTDTWFFNSKFNSI